MNVSPRRVDWRIGRHEDGTLPPPADAGAWLSREEMARAGRFAFEKRREDWILGRLNLKALLSRMYAERLGAAIAPRHIVIDQEPSGAPCARFSHAAPACPGAVGDRRLPVAISSSHSHGLALGAALWIGGEDDAGGVWRIGADIERIEARTAEFVRDFFTPDEQRYWADAGTDNARALRAAIVWTAKEAALKMLQLGLRVDTYSINCLPAGFGPAPGDATGAGGAPIRLEPAAEWNRVRVAVPPQLGADASTIAGRWRTDDAFAIAIVVGRVDADRGPAPTTSPPASSPTS